MHIAHQDYSGHRVGDEIDVKLCGRLLKRATRSTRKWMKRRTAIEPVIGRLKSGNRLNRNCLKGTPKKIDKDHIASSKSGESGIFTPTLPCPMLRTNRLACWANACSTRARTFDRFRFASCSRSFKGRLRVDLQ